MKRGAAAIGMDKHLHGGFIQRPAAAVSGAKAGYACALSNGTAAMHLIHESGPITSGDSREAITKFAK